jgi:hypothetical protein
LPWAALLKGFFFTEIGIGILLGLEPGLHEQQSDSAIHYAFCLKVEIQVSTKYYIIMDDPVLDVLLSFDEKASEVECE